MSNNKLWKRVTAGALALLVVAGTAPAGMNFGELIGGQSIVASADTVGEWESGNCIVTLDGEGTLTVSKKDNAENGDMADYGDQFPVWYNNNNIKAIVVEKGVTKIGSHAFYYLKNVESLILPEGLTTIGSFAFRGCYILQEVTIPSTVTYINRDAFYECKSVTDVYCYPNAADLTWIDNGYDDFMTSDKTKCHVKADQVEAYNAKYHKENIYDNVNVEFVGDLKDSLSTATVTVDTIKKTFTVTLGEGDSQVTVPRDEYRLSFEKKVGNDFVGIDLIGYPLEPGEYRVTAEAKDSSTDYTGKTSAVFTVITYTKVEAKAATSDTPGNLEYYKGSDNKFYKMNKYEKVSYSDPAEFLKNVVGKVLEEGSGISFNSETAYQIYIDNTSIGEFSGNGVNWYSLSSDLILESVLESTEDNKIFFKTPEYFTEITENSWVVNKVDAVEATPNAPGNIEYYTGTDNKYYTFENGVYTEVENVAIDQVAVNMVEAKDPTPNAPGNIEYYTGNNGKLYTLDDGVYTETNKENVTIAKIDVNLVDRVDPTVNDDGMEEHYEGTYNGETKYYTASKPTNAVSGEVYVESLTNGTILAPGTVLKTSSGMYYVSLDDELTGSIDTEKTYTTTDYVTVESVIGIIENVVINPKENIGVKTLENNSKRGGGSSSVSLKTYKPDYTEVTKESLAIDKIETTKVDAVEPTCTTTGNIEYYTDPEDNIYVLEDGVYVASTLEAVTLAMLPYEHFEAVDATCEEDGKLEYWYDKFKNEYYLDEKGESKVTADQLVIKKLGHKYKASWKWADDYSAATVTLKCLNDPTEEAIVLEAEITEERVESTCNKQGNITYTAKATYDNTNYTYSKTVALPYGEHTYGEPSWQWFNENTAKATFTCTECGATKTVDAVVRSEKTAPTITESGKITYTASVTIGDKTYIDVRVTTLNKLPAAPEVTYTPGTGSVKLDWEAVEGAEMYAVCGEVDGKWQKLGSGTDTTFALYDLTSGKQYKVAVIAKVNGEWIEDYSKAIVVTPKAAANKYPKVSSIDYNDKYHQFRINWDSVDGAEKYGVAVFLAGRWKIVTQDIPANTTSFTSPKLKAGQTYNMVVCAKIDGKWDTSNLNSRAFSVTVK